MELSVARQCPMLMICRTKGGFIKQRSRFRSRWPDGSHHTIKNKGQLNRGLVSPGGTRWRSLVQGWLLNTSLLRQGHVPATAPVPWLRSVPGPGALGAESLKLAKRLAQSQPCIRPFPFGPLMVRLGTTSSTTNNR